MVDRPLVSATMPSLQRWEVVLENHQIGPLSCFLLKFSMASTGKIANKTNKGHLLAIMSPKKVEDDTGMGLTAPGST